VPAVRITLTLGAVVVAVAALAAAPAATATPAAPVAAPQSRPWLPPTPANWPLVVDSTRTPDQAITRGVTSHSETLDSVGGRQQAQILSVDLTDPNVRLGAVEAGDKLIDPADETGSTPAWACARTVRW